MEILALGIAWYFVFVVSTVCHEAAHALVAKWGGDWTAYYGGQVTLNPRPHVQREPMGMVVIPWVVYLMTAVGGMGWMVGWASTPYNPAWAVQFPKRAALMAAAGPLANLSLFLLAALGIRIGLSAGLFEPPVGAFSYTGLVVTPGQGLAQGLGVLLSIAFTLNLVLMLFNLLPIPPLDGSGFFGFFLDEERMLRLQELFHRPYVGLVGILIAWQVFPHVFGPVFRFSLGLLYPGLEFRPH